VEHQFPGNNILSLAYVASRSGAGRDADINQVPLNAGIRTRRRWQDAGL
jgi:hypothetical protein